MHNLEKGRTQRGHAEMYAELGKSPFSSREKAGCFSSEEKEGIIKQRSLRGRISFVAERTFLLERGDVYFLVHKEKEHL